MPAIAKKTHREDPVHPGPPATRGEGQKAAGSGLGSQGHLSQVCVEGVHLAQVLLLAPPHTSGHQTQPLKANC
jgi:hypothetical protein